MIDIKNVLKTLVTRSKVFQNIIKSIQKSVSNRDFGNKNK